MSSFSLEWLQLRESADTAARTSTIPPEIVACRSVVDLGAGSGANLRYVAPQLGGKQEWVLVENDPLLVGAIPQVLREWSASHDATFVEDGDALLIKGAAFDCRVRTQQIDLSAQLDRLAIAQGALVTASALLDLVSEQWLTQLIQQCAQASAPVWFALTYDGRMQCDPHEPEDETVRMLFNEHQQTDKGFGPALGPTAADVTSQILASAKYHFVSARSDWQLTPLMHAIQHSLVEGWFDAVRKHAPEIAPELNGWLERRRAHIDAGVSSLIVGHTDIFGWPPPTSHAESMCNHAAKR